METRRRIILSPSSPATILKDEAEPNDKADKANKKQRISRIFILLSIVLLPFTAQQGQPSELAEQQGNHQPQDSSSSSSSSPPTSVGRCTNIRYTSPVLPHKPVWIASYPGSGSEMVRDLVQGYIKRDPPHQDCVSSKAATCKTHWPLLPIHSPLEQNPQDYHSNAILLIRNPIHAFPSRLNHLWEVQTETSAHTTQAPEKAWNRWIQKNWKQQVKTYQALIQTWTSNTSFPYRVQLVLAYEDLTSSTTITGTGTGTGSTLMKLPSENATLTTASGAMAAKRLVNLLQEANARVVIGDESIACLWRHVVLDRPTKKRSDHAYTPGYTQVLKDRILAMIQSLMESLPVLEKDQADLTQLLQRYSEDIQQNTRIITEF